jgi:O-phosphoseryl-tRNA synthetase
MLRVKIEGFENVWARSASLIPKGKQGIEQKGKGKSHCMQDLIQRMRLVFLNMGFDEFIIPSIVEEREIYKQYGPEAPIILDRCYYLSALPRPDIGLSNEKTRLIEELGITINEIQKKEYSKGFKRL